MTIDASDIFAVTKSVTKEWTQQRKAEERGNRSRYSREYVYSDRVNFTDVVDKILPPGYDHASGGGQYSVAQRQLYYACREQFTKLTGRPLDANYFTSTLLRQYLNRHAVNWKITADPRGTLRIPNTKRSTRIPVGTIAIENHLARAAREIDPFNIDHRLDTSWPSLKHGQRYQAVLYIEKEGFEPLLEEAEIAERFDLAIMSCKGQSVVAARKFVDRVCSVGNGVPLFVVHDFDKAGFEISQSLTTVSEWAVENDRVAYRFRNKINVTDLGLRLADVEEYGLGHETVQFRGGFQFNSIATPEEQEFLKSGRRVELNAFTSPQFIEWLEGKLTEHGLGKRLVPDDEVIAAAFRRALAVAKINGVIDDAVDDATEMAKNFAIPKTLSRKLRKQMKETGLPWDRCLYSLAEAKLDDSDE